MTAGDLLMPRVDAAGVPPLPAALCGARGLARPGRYLSLTYQRKAVFEVPRGPNSWAFAQNAMSPPAV
jgi:hypothetical protein